jgi:ferredoxin/flavodoxin---NADP+ reductase
VVPSGGGFPILSKELVAPRVTRYRVRAPDVARAWHPGQFVIVRPRDDSERIPLTVADTDDDAITLVVQEVGKTTAVMADMEAGEGLADVCGPLGQPTEVARVGTAVVIGGGIGIAPAWPIARALRAAGNRVVGILGARTAELLILYEEMRRACHQLVVVTDDGSRGERGLVTTALARLLDAGFPIDRVVAVGPAAMMKAVAESTRPLAIPTTVSLNTVMLDGTGMCGGCRVEIAGQARFVCVDGPEFDGHQVDFDLLIRRQRMYVEQERQSYDEYRQGRAQAEEAEARVARP